MPKKTRKGGGRTEKEKMQHQRQRAEAEGEVTRMEQILTLFLKDKLQREETNSALNLLKITEGWRALLRSARTAQLSQCLAVLRRTFERQLDSLDAVVMNLTRDLQEAEHQTAQVKRLHLQNLQRLRSLQEQRLAILKQRWEGGLRDISSSYITDRKHVESLSRVHLAALDDGAFALEQQDAAVMSDITRLFSACMAAQQSAHQERMAMLIRENAETLAEKQSRNQEALRELSDEAEATERLVARSQRFVRTTDGEMRNVQQLQTAVVALRAKLTSSEAENVLENEDLIAASRQMKLKTRLLQDQLTRDRATAKKQLADLSVNSDTATKRLQRVITKGETILQVADACCRMETQLEVFLTQLMTTSSTTHEDETSQTGTCQELHLLLQRHSGALLHREALRRQRDDEWRDNQQLKLLLRQHLDAMTVSGDSTPRNHALLTIGPAPNARGASNISSSERHTVLEAAHLIKHTL